MSGTIYNKHFSTSFISLVYQTVFNTQILDTAMSILKILSLLVDPLKGLRGLGLSLLLALRSTGRDELDDFLVL